ncbi:hypothetical protein GCM10010363_58950 [Streptomyces omiyaensis]|uniref:hypothetical protein n=1 Tax=Streptomyces omiyaensis TaxID=68247 RepID=UPI0016776D88|nr:hypothetical protein [Streptomyces omiyaensis]GGY70055.1 hypothetical protein GCM10010363_58950 [Streptomyces omiyaensis]
MTGTDEGIRAAVRIRARRPGAGVLVLSPHAGTVRAARLPADAGYLLEERVARPDECVRAPHRVAAGGTARDPEPDGDGGGGQGRAAGARRLVP